MGMSGKFQFSKLKRQASCDQLNKRMFFIINKNIFLHIYGQKCARSGSLQKKECKPVFLGPVDVDLYPHLHCFGYITL